MTERSEPGSGSLALSNGASRVRVGPVEGLVAFTPMWGAAMLFSLAGDRNMLMLREGLPLFVLTWAAIAVSMTLIVRP